MRPEKPKYPELWEVFVGKSGRAWLVPVDVPNKGDYIHCTNSKNWEERGEGYGGSTLEFMLESGDTFHLHGGWHSNSHALLEDTGEDYTHAHFTHIEVKVIYKDGREAQIEYDAEGWCLDEFTRRDDIQWFQREVATISLVQGIGITIYSVGGSTSFWLENKDESRA